MTRLLLTFYVIHPFSYNLLNVSHEPDNVSDNELLVTYFFPKSHQNLPNCQQKCYACRYHLWEFLNPWRALHLYNNIDIATIMSWVPSSSFVHVLCLKHYQFQIFGNVPCQYLSEAAYRNTSAKYSCQLDVQVKRNSNFGITTAKF